MERRLKEYSDRLDCLSKLRIAGLPGIGLGRLEVKTRVPGGHAEESSGIILCG